MHQSYRYILKCCSVLLLASILPPDCTAGNVGTFTGPPDCQVFNSDPTLQERFVWNGSCSEGYAHGTGHLQWYLKNGTAGTRYEGPLHAGRMHGSGAIRYADGAVYQGQFHHGLEQGTGTIIRDKEYAMTARFEAGEPSGSVHVQYQNGDLYQGEWSKGGPQGQGRMDFALGGSYRGAWQAGRMHGHGTITYPNGLVREGDFGDDTRPVKAASGKGNILEDDQDGRSFGVEVARGLPVPFDKRYDELTMEQRRTVRGWFPLLQEGDRPPYPAQGMGDLLRAVSRVHQHLDEYGDLWLDIAVDERGVTQGATARRTPSLKVAEYAAEVLMAFRYTPAQCGGQPCAMSFPFRIKLTSPK